MEESSRAATLSTCQLRLFKFLSRSVREELVVWSMLLLACRKAVLRWLGALLTMAAAKTLLVWEMRGSLLGVLGRSLETTDVLSGEDVPSEIVERSISSVSITSAESVPKSTDSNTVFFSMTGLPTCVNTSVVDSL